MRDAFNYFLPVVQDDFNGISLRTGAGTIANHVSSNGYYGYQQVVAKDLPPEERMETQECEMNPDCNNAKCPIRIEHKFSSENIRGQEHRKRSWEHGAEEQDSKKRRQNECVIKTANKAHTKNTEDAALLEELLAATHGCNFYHWFGGEI